MPWKWIALKPQTYTAPNSASSKPVRVERRVGFSEGSLWSGLEEPIVQILVAVVIRKMKPFSTEVNKGISKMAISWELADPKPRVKHFKKREGLGAQALVKVLESAKGKLVKIPVLDSVVRQLATSWDLLVVTQKNFKPGERSGSRDLFSV